MKRVVKEALQDPGTLQVFVSMLRDQVVAELQKTIQDNTKVIEDLKKTLDEKDRKIEVLENKIDDLEQYQRRQCLRIFGVKEEAGEDTDQKAIEVAKKIGVDLSVTDIDRSHRVGVSNAERPRAIIVKFVSYRKRSEVFLSKKKLKGSGVTVREDLTKCRYRLLQESIQKYGIQNVWTMDGAVIAKVNGEKRKIRSSTDIN